MKVRLTKISYLKNLRNFISFNSSHDIKKHEVLYAPNGSGKTNLTRILSALQKGASLEHFKSEEAKKTGESLELSVTIDSTIITHLNYKDTANAELLGSLVIFNSDYISDNITVPDFRKDLAGEVVLELGKEDNDIKDLERKILSEKEIIRESVERLEKSINVFINGLKGKKYKATERNIWDELKIENVLNISTIDKGNSSIILENRAKIVDADYSKTSQEREDLLSIGDAEKINLVFPNMKIPAVDEIINLLARPGKFPVDDEEISNNVKFLSSVLCGHSLLDKEPNTVIATVIERSEEKDKCILCKRKLDVATKDLFKRYKEFFEGEKAKYEEQLRRCAQVVESLIGDVKSLSNDRKECVDRLAELFGIKERWVNIDVSSVKTVLNDIKVALEEKQSDLSTPKAVKGIDGLEESLNSLISVMGENKKLADRLDVKSNDVVVNLANARRKVGQMELATFIVSNGTDFNNIIGSNAALKILNGELYKKQQQAPKKSIRKNTSELFNFFMAERIGIEKYQSEIIDDQMVIKLKGFDISDSTHLISDGEQTIIGLAYFLASSISKLCDLNKFSRAVFIIDDPVSSVSYSNLFGISSLLKKFQDDIKQKLWKENKTKFSVQTIVLTHNIQFLNIMKTNIWKDNKDKNHYGIIDSDSIRDIKKGHLLSEFQSALLSVYRESQNINNGINVCNDIRRIVETLRHFYGIDDFNVESMEKIFPYIQTKKFDNLFSVINYFSHGSPEDIDILPPNIVESAVTEFVTIIEDNQSPFLSLWNDTKSLEGIG